VGSINLREQRYEADGIYQVDRTSSGVIAAAQVYGGSKTIPKLLALALSGGKYIVYTNVLVCVGFLRYEVLMDGVNDIDATAITAGVIDTAEVANWHVNIESDPVWANFRKATA